MIRVSRLTPHQPTTVDIPLVIDSATIEEITSQLEKSNRRSFPTPLQTAAFINEPAMAVEIASTG
jgi:hypothetical protein